MTRSVSLAPRAIAAPLFSIFIGALFFTLALLALAVSARADTVDIPGDYATIQAGIDASVDGDTVLVAPGTYVETLTLDDVIVIGKSAASTVVNANGTGSVVTVIEGAAAVIERLTLRGGYAENGAAIDLSFWRSLVVRDCIITGNTAVYSGAGFYGYRSSAVFERCRFVANRSGLPGEIYGVTMAGLSFINCLIEVRDESAVAMDGFSRPNFSFCTFVIKDGSPAIEVDLYSGASLANCIVWGSSRPFTGEVTATYSNIQGGWPGEGNIDADPMFRSIRGFNYVLAPGSPCVDAGDPMIQDGISDWHPRWPEWYPNGHRSDMGAYGGPENKKWLSRN